MAPWTDAEIERFLGRTRLFQRRGLTEAQAERVADRLALRDQEADERHLCIECTALKPSGNCDRAPEVFGTALLGPMRYAMRFLFQRCSGFVAASFPLPPPTESLPP